MTIYEPDFEANEDRYAELVERLRAMQWPEASPAARRRCWEAVKRDLAADPDGRTAPAPADDAPVHGPALVWDAPTEGASEARPRRHEFATRAGSYSGALAERVAGARRPMRVAAGVR